MFFKLSYPVNVKPCGSRDRLSGENLSCGPKQIENHWTIILFHDNNLRITTFTRNVRFKKSFRSEIERRQLYMYKLKHDEPHFLSLRSAIFFFWTSRYYYFLRTNINCLVTNVASMRNCISYINWMERLNDKRKRFVLRLVNLYIYIY